MAFYGSEFIFDDIPCSVFGLMVYHFGSNSQSDVDFQNGDIIEDRIPGRYDALTYGVVQNKPLEYTLIFGANMESIDHNAHIDRYEVEEIAAWLTGHQQRKWLTIVQDDMDAFRYKCLISELRLITYGDVPWAFSCKVSCDSPFGYTFPEEFTFEIGSGETQTVELFNRSSYRGYLRPEIEITVDGGGSLTITNITDDNREFKFTSLAAPSNGEERKIHINNKNGKITDSDGDESMLYSKFNMRFFRLVRGMNTLSIQAKPTEGNTMSATVKFICEFPVNIGG